MRARDRILVVGKVYHLRGGEVGRYVGPRDNYEDFAIGWPHVRQTLLHATDVISTATRRSFADTTTDAVAAAKAILWPKKGGSR